MTGFTSGEKVSWTIVIPTFNRPSMLKRAIESCLAQTEHCEIIVVDDHSSRETLEVAAQFPQITYIRNDKNLGHSASVNLGLGRAHGTWIKHLDDDDYLHPNCLEKMTEAIAKARAQGHYPKIVSCAASNVDARESPLTTTRIIPAKGLVLMKPKILLRMMMLDQAPLGTPVQVAHERQAALDVGCWNQDRPIQYRNGDEAEFWTRLAPSGDAIFMSDTLAYRTIWPGNEQVSHGERLNISLYLKERIAKKIKGFGDSGDGVPPDIVRYLKLHWGLVAFRDKKILAGITLALGGMFHISSYRHIWRRFRFYDTVRLVHILD